MAQFYNKTQIDQQATFLGGKLGKLEQRLEAVESIATPSLFLGTFATAEEIPVGQGPFTHPAGTYAYVDEGIDKDVTLYLYDVDSNTFVSSGTTISNPAIEEAEDISSFTAAFEAAVTESQTAM